MRRILQGDVGSGKTLVALLAALDIAEAGKQTALMAPTEILATQHFETIRALSRGIRIGLLTGSTSACERAKLLAGLRANNLHLIVETHALLERDVQFHGLQLAIVDEEHRFGVAQRDALAAKCDKVDLLSLTATPIPRSLRMAQTADVDVSELRGKPPGRVPVKTSAVPIERLSDVVAAVSNTVNDSGGAIAIARGRDEAIRVLESWGLLRPR